jgi:hypothetical protein
MGQIINAFSYLYWGSVIVAVLYVLLSSAPVIINLVLTSVSLATLYMPCQTQLT